MWWLTPFFSTYKNRARFVTTAFVLLCVFSAYNCPLSNVITIYGAHRHHHHHHHPRLIIKLLRPGFYARRCVKRGITSKFWIIFFLRSRPEVSNIWRDTTRIRCLYELQNTERQHTGADTDRVTVRLLRQHSPWRFYRDLLKRQYSGGEESYRGMSLHFGPLTTPHSSEGDQFIRAPA